MSFFPLYFLSWGLVVDFVDTSDLAAVQAVVRRGKTKLVWVETPCNPMWDVADIAAVAEIAHDAGARLAVDSTAASPVLTQPLSYAPHADLLWCETSTPDLDEARRFAEAVHAEFPGKLLAYNCSPSFNWEHNLDRAAIAGFQQELGAMGYKFQFVTLAGFHALNYSMFELASGYRDQGMAAYSELQRREFDATHRGYSATKHQREVGAAYFDRISEIVTGGESSTLALDDSTESSQF